MVTPESYFQSVGYDPFKEQWAFHRSTARFRVATCGRRFGKSTMAARDITPRHLLVPNQLVWCVGPTYRLAEKEFRVVWRDLIVKKRLGKDKRVKKAYNLRQGNMSIELPWNTKIECVSAENPDSLVGEGLNHVIMCEAAKHKKETWDRYIRPALTDFKGSADFPTTPEGFNWIYDLFQLGRDPKYPDYESWRFPSWTNTHIYPGGKDDPEIKLLESTMDPEWFMQEIGADFASFVGKIFPDWDEFIHVKTHTYNPEWKNYITFDWGYTNPLAAVEFQVSPDDRIFVWRVYYKSYHTLQDVADELLKQEQPEGYKIDLMFGDPADPEAVASMAKLMNRPLFAPKTLKTDYTWLDGIMLMREFMKDDREVGQDEWGTPEYEPSFFVDPSCRPVIKEMSNYRSKEPIKGRNVPEFGNKVEDHTIDALRYALLCLFKVGVGYHLADVLLPQEAAQAKSVDKVAASSQGSGRGNPAELDAFERIISGPDRQVGGELVETGTGGTFTWSKDF